MNWYDILTNDMIIDAVMEDKKQRLKITISERKGKPYIVIDDLTKGGETVFAAQLDDVVVDRLGDEHRVSSQTDKA